MQRITVPILALGLFLTGCGPSEEDPQTASEESATEEQTAEERALDAPGPVVEEAVQTAALEIEEGEATFYADVFEGRRTASGRTFRQADLVAAHPAFPFGTELRVTNTTNDRAVEVEVVDRGPFGHSGKIPAALDLSKAAAERLGFVSAGRAMVRIEVLSWG